MLLNTNRELFKDLDAEHNLRQRIAATEARLATLPDELARMKTDLATLEASNTKAVASYLQARQDRSESNVHAWNALEAATYGQRTVELLAGIYTVADVARSYRDSMREAIDTLPK
jgi:uncharacterized small protein (DUF1192 family)